MRKKLLVSWIISCGMVPSYAALEVPLQTIYQEEVEQQAESMISATGADESSIQVPAVIHPEVPGTSNAQVLEHRRATVIPETESQKKVKQILATLQNYLADYFEAVEKQHLEAKKGNREIPPHANMSIENKETPQRVAANIPPQPPSQQQPEIGGITPPQSPVNLPPRPIPTNQSPQIGGIPAPTLPSSFPEGPIPSYGSTKPLPAPTTVPIQPIPAPQSQHEAMGSLMASTEINRQQQSGELVVNTKAESEATSAVIPELATMPLIDSAENSEAKALLEESLKMDITQATHAPSVVEQEIAGSLSNAQQLAQNDVALLAPRAKTTDALMFAQPEDISMGRLLLKLAIMNILLFSGVGIVIGVWKKLRTKKITMLLDELRL